jgi:hypothetical protein
MIKTIKSLNAEDYQISKIESYYKKINELNKKGIFYQAITLGVMIGTLFCGYAFIFLFSYYLLKS